jgi:hypothetical protein
MDTLKIALDWAKKYHAEASIQNQAAFSNSVKYLTTGYSGGYGGPSIREHLCSWALAGGGEITQVGNLTMITPDGRLPRAGEWGFKKAIKFCEPICFGNLSRQALKVVEREYCFDNDPHDLTLIRDWELIELKELSLQRKRGKLPQKTFLRLKFLQKKHR